MLYKGHAFCCSSGNCEREKLMEHLSSGAVSNTSTELSSGQKDGALCDVLIEKKCHLWVQYRSIYIPLRLCSSLSHHYAACSKHQGQFSPSLVALEIYPGGDFPSEKTAGLPSVPSVLSLTESLPSLHKEGLHSSGRENSTAAREILSDKLNSCFLLAK